MTIQSRLIQTPNMVQRISNFGVSGKGILLAATNGASTSVQFPTLPDTSTAIDVMIVNDGTVSAFITFDPNSAPTAAIPTGDGNNAANGICIKAGNSIVFNRGFINGYAAAITASGSANLYLYQGYGS